MFWIANTGFVHATHTGALTATVCAVQPSLVTVNVTAPVKFVKPFTLDDVTVVPANEVV